MSQFSGSSLVLDLSTNASKRSRSQALRHQSARDHLITAPPKKRSRRDTRKAKQQQATQRVFTQSPSLAATPQELSSPGKRQKTSDSASTPMPVSGAVTADARVTSQTRTLLDGHLLILDVPRSEGGKPKNEIEMSASMERELRDYFAGLNLSEVMADLDESVTRLLSHEGISAQIRQSLCERKFLALVIAFDSLVLPSLPYGSDDSKDRVTVLGTVIAKLYQRFLRPALGTLEEDDGGVAGLVGRINNEARAEANAMKIRRSEIDLLTGSLGQMDIQEHEEKLASDFDESVDRVKRTWFESEARMHSWMVLGSVYSECLGTEIWRVIEERIDDLPKIDDFKVLVGSVYDILTKAVSSRTEVSPMKRVNWWGFMIDWMIEEAIEEKG